MNPVKIVQTDILNKQNEFYKVMDLDHLTFAFKDDRRARWERKKKTKRYKKEHSRGKNGQQDYRRKARLEDEDFS